MENLIKKCPTSYMDYNIYYKHYELFTIHLERICRLGLFLCSSACEVRMI